MSRQIDLTEKLSAEDRDYLLARGREQQVLQNDAQFTEDPDARAAASYIPGTSIDTAEGVPATPGGDPLVVNGGGGVEGQAPDFRAGADGNEGDGDGEGAKGSELAEDPGYEEWKKADLVKEIDRRNAEYDSSYQLENKGKVAELAAVLRADDATPDDEDGDAEDDQSEDGNENDE